MVKMANRKKEKGQEPGSEEHYSPFMTIYILINRADCYNPKAFISLRRIGQLSYDGIG